jgi:two-component system chemotaxis response regulator CheY
MAATILVVDDSPVLRASVRFTLSKSGAVIEEAGDGQAALAALEALAAKNIRPALIITDVNMPRMDGITFISELRKRAGSKFTPVLVLTTESQADKKDQGKAAGASAWLVKPFNDTQLIEVVRKFVR